MNLQFYVETTIEYKGFYKFVPSFFANISADTTRSPS